MGLVGFIKKKIVIPFIYVSTKCFGSSTRPLKVENVGT